MTLDELRKIASRATPGTWTVERNGFEDGTFAYEIQDKGRLISISEYNFDQTMQAKFDGEHIAAFNPQVALALLDCAKALSIVRNSCGNAGEAEMQTALTKLEEAGVTI